MYGCLRLDFMTIDAYDEPQIGSIKVKLTQLLKQHKETKLFITQGYICRNAKGEVDNLKRGGSDYSASLLLPQSMHLFVKYGLILMACIIMIRGL